LVEVSLLSSELVTQTIKRLTGRQKPNRAMECRHPGGALGLLSPVLRHTKQYPQYDAMPSGPRWPPFMATITVLTTNYPKYDGSNQIGYSLNGNYGFENDKQQGTLDI